MLRQESQIDFCPEGFEDFNEEVRNYLEDLRNYFKERGIEIKSPLDDSTLSALFDCITAVKELAAKNPDLAKRLRFSPEGEPTTFSPWRELAEKGDEKGEGAQIQELIITAVYAVDVLAISFFDLVKKIAGKYKGKGLPLEDLIAAGYEGLMKAIMKFNPNYNQKKDGNQEQNTDSVTQRFINYAASQIEGYIRNARSREETVRISEERMGILRKAYSIFAELTQKLRREPTLEEVVTEMMVRYGINISPKELEALMQTTQLPVSLNAPIRFKRDPDGEGRLLDEIIADPQQDLQKDVGARSLQELISNALKILTPQEQEVVVMHYFNGITLREIAKQLRISEEEAKAREAKAIRKLRNYLITHHSKVTAYLT